MGMPQLVVTAVLVEARSKSEVARDYGVSRRWVITLVQRYLAAGAPACSPARVGRGGARPGPPTSSRTRSSQSAGYRPARTRKPAPPPSPPICSAGTAPAPRSPPSGGSSPPGASSPRSRTSGPRAATSASRPPNPTNTLADRHHPLAAGRWPTAPTPLPRGPRAAPVQRGRPASGVLTVHTDTPVHPTDAARDLIGALAPTFGHALDPMRSITAAARLVQGATAGVVVTRAGRLLALPGLPAHPLLTAGSLVLAEVARHLAGDGEYTQFLRPAPGPAPTTGHVRVAALDCAVDRAGPRDVPVR